MGLFDYVVEIPDPHDKCVLCGEPLEWQTKDGGDPSMSNVPFYMLQRFYSKCDACGAWHEFTLRNHKRSISDYELSIEQEEA